MSLSGNADGRAAAVVFRFVLAQVTPESSIRWSLDVEPGQRAAFEIANMNDERSARVVDRFEGTAGETFATPAAPVRVNGPLPALRPPPERLVLGFYFPWFERETWSDPQMLGRPLRAYSADDAADVLQGMRDASPGRARWRHRFVPGQGDGMEPSPHAARPASRAAERTSRSGPTISARRIGEGSASASQRSRPATTRPVSGIDQNAASSIARTASSTKRSERPPRGAVRTGSW